jgi:transitional endoplasmic reticulum ATPase
MVTNELLTLVDGAGGMLPDVVWVAATNLVDSIDEAALRAGRFEQKLEFGPPTRATARRMVLSWAKAHAARLDRDADAWTDAVLAGFDGLTAANVFGSLAIANNIAVARARSCGEHSPVVVTPAHVAEAVGELTGIGAAAVCA